MDTAELIQQYKNFLEKEYQAKILDNRRTDKPYLEVDFKKLIKFDHEIAEELLDDPEENIKAIETAAKGIIDDKELKSFQILFFNLPKTQNMPLNDISNQLGKFLTFEGYVMKPTEKYLKCRAAKYECPSCGNIINILMLGDE